MTVEDKRDALKVVLDAAKIHSEMLTRSLTEDRQMTASFKNVRTGYIRKLDAAVLEVQAIKMDEESTILQRVQDLSLEESADLLLTVMDHIKDLRRVGKRF